MIVGIGMDVVEIRRIRDLAQRHAAFLTRTFAPCELDHCQEKANPFPHLAARFAAKEAVFKALGTGWSVGLKWTDIAVENNMAGKPAIRLSGGARRLAEKLSAHKIHLSLTHTGSYAAAQVVLERVPLHPAQCDETETASTTHARRLPDWETSLHKRTRRPAPCGSYESSSSSTRSFAALTRYRPTGRRRSAPPTTRSTG